MKTKIQEKIKISIVLFVVLVLFFASLYHNIADYSWQDSIYTSLSYHTFAGTTITDSKAKTIAIIQIIVTYVVVATILYDVFSY
jgi:hypothetical protein